MRGDEMPTARVSVAGAAHVGWPPAASARDEGLVRAPTVASTSSNPSARTAERYVLPASRAEPVQLDGLVHPGAVGEVVGTKACALLRG